MFKVDPLSYSYDALEPYIDSETMRIHHDGHYAAYVNSLNEALSQYPELMEKSLEEMLGNTQQVPEDIRQKIINFGGGAYNHSLFWRMMTPGGGGEPENPLLLEMEKSFGSFQTFQEEFNEKAAKLFGSGWIWLIKEDNILKTTPTQNQDTPLTKGQTPLLGLDVWEHAYYLKYRNKRKDYIENWWNIVNWGEVLRLFNLR